MRAVSGSQPRRPSHETNIDQFLLHEPPRIPRELPFTEGSVTELDIEIQYRLQERLGILCGAEEPTPLAIKIALEEIEQYKKHHASQPQVQPA